MRQLQEVPPIENAAVFLDRDGVINVNRDDYVKSWAEFQFLPGALEALNNLAKSPLKIIIITNQSAVGRSILTLNQLAQIHTQMTQVIKARGGRVDHIFFCPHHPKDGCSCRKPEPGMLYQAAHAFNLDLSRSFLVGDAMSDIQAGLRAGCSPLFVLSGRDAPAKDQLKTQYGNQCRIVVDLTAAVDRILRQIELPG